MAVRKRPAAKASSSKAQTTLSKADPAPKAERKPPPKRQKLDPMARTCQTVMAGLQQATCVPDSVRKMLQEMLDVALLTYKDERHKYQESVVAMAGDVLAQTEAGFLKIRDEAKAGEALTVEAHDASDKVAKGIEMEWKEKHDVVEACRKVLAEHANIFKAKTETVQLAEAAQADLSVETEACQARMASLAKAEEYAEALVAGVEADKVKELLDPLMEVLGGLLMDQSVMVALPDALGKGPADRGTFDKLVVQQLLDDLAKRSNALKTELLEFEPAKANHAAAVATAQDALEAANKQQQQSAQSLWDAQAALKAVAEQLDKALADARALLRQQRTLTKEGAAAEKKLTAFRNGPQAAYFSLRDRVSEPPEPPPAAAMEVDAEDVAEEAAGKDVAAREAAMWGEAVEGATLQAAAPVGGAGEAAPRAEGSAPQAAAQEGGAKEEEAAAPEAAAAEPETE